MLIYWENGIKYVRTEYRCRKMDNKMLKSFLFTFLITYQCPWISFPIFFQVLNELNPHTMSNNAPSLQVYQLHHIGVWDKKALGSFCGCWIGVHKHGSLPQLHMFFTMAPNHLWVLLFPHGISVGLPKLLATQGFSLVTCQHSISASVMILSILDFYFGPGNKKELTQLQNLECSSKQIEISEYLLFGMP